MILFLLVSFSKEYIRIISPINLNNVSQLHVESDIKEKYKRVTKSKDITPILKFVNSLRFKESDEVKVIKNYKGKLRDFKINYRITKIKKSNFTDYIVINIFDNKIIFYKGKYYLVNKEIQKYVAELYNNLKYMEYETIPRVHAVKVPK